MNFGESICIVTFFLFSDSGLCLLNGFRLLQRQEVSCFKRSWWKPCRRKQFHFSDSGLCLLNGFGYYFDLFWMAWLWKPAIGVALPVWQIYCVLIWPISDDNGLVPACKSSLSSRSATLAIKDRSSASENKWKTNLHILTPKNPNTSAQNLVAVFSAFLLDDIRSCEAVKTGSNKWSHDKFQPEYERQPPVGFDNQEYIW